MKINHCNIKAILTLKYCWNISRKSKKLSGHYEFNRGEILFYLKKLNSIKILLKCLFHH